VITDFDEYERNHSDLKAFLATHATLIAQSDRYLIYSLAGIDFGHLAAP
jgi:hypothetical protein